MAWPTVDATTTDLDAGTDNPNLARPQIKLNSENANAIKNEFGNVDISSPQNEQLLQYDSANSKWVNATVSTGGGGQGSSIAILKITGSPLSTENIAGSFRNPYEISEVIDTGSLVTVGGTNSDEMVFASGTYEILFAGMRMTALGNPASNDPDSIEPGFYNIDASPQTVIETFCEGRTGASMLAYFTSNGTDKFKFAVFSVDGTFSTDWNFRVTKLS